MKVNGANEVKPNALSRKSKTKGGQATFSVDSGGDTTAAGGAQATSALAAVDSLLSLQEVGGRADGNVSRGHQTLDLLDEIRDGLLAGTIPVSKLKDLSHVIEDQRSSISDPGLQEVLDEIDLRAQVELAKYEHLLP